MRFAADAKFAPQGPEECFWLGDQVVDDPSTRGEGKDSAIEDEAPASCNGARSRATPVSPDKIDVGATHRHNIWLGPPGLWTIIGGLTVAAFTAVITGYYNNKLEQEKLESSLIQNALEAGDNNAKANGLTFLAQAGLIEDYREKIVQTALPTFLGAAIRDHFITVVDAKIVLAHLGMHAGPLNDVADEAFRKEIVEFQMARGLPPDGYVGPNTYAKLREAWPQHFIPNFVTVRDAKSVLDHLGMHTGPINDSADDAFRKEIEAFQKSWGVEPDGYIGNPLTYDKLREAWPDHFKQ